jgi:hypothetical protein
MTNLISSSPKHIRLALGFVLIAFLIAIAGCAEQEVPFNADAQAVAEQAQAYMKAADWSGMSKIMHEVGLEDFTAMILPAIESRVPLGDTNQANDTVSLFGVPYSANELRTLPADSFMAVIMNTVFQVTPQLGQTFATLETSPVGQVAEGDSLIHVLMRTSMSLGGGAVSEMDVLTVGKSGDAWKLLFPTRLKGMTQLIQQSIMRSPGR